jgi:thiol-disulfide isomerase/thioredoxin
MRRKALLLLIAGLCIFLSCKKPVESTRLPDVTLKTLNGETVRLADYTGKPVIINFWATWCGPCVYEIPTLNQLQKKYSDGGLVIIGISTDDGGAEVVRNFMKDVPIEYKSYLKTPGVEDEFGGILGLPTTYFYDKNGEQVEKLIGLTSREAFERRIEKILKS